jgi:GntR family transcriptional regulator/MocR family aminotransferase
MRAEYAHRRDVLANAVERHLPGIRLSGLAAGFHAVLHLPAGVDEARVVAAAAVRGRGVSPMGRLCRVADPSDPRLVLGFGNTDPESIERGIALLAEVLAQTATGRGDIPAAR